MRKLKQARVGRPVRDPFDVLRTMIWFQAVKVASGLSNPAMIELVLAQYLDDELDGQPRKCRLYNDGRVVPDTSKPLNLVELAERMWPGTARWFHSGLWTALKGQLETIETVEAALLDLDVAVVASLFRSRDGSKRTTLRSLAEIDVVLFRRDVFENGLDRFDAVVANVLLVALSEISHHLALRELAIEGYEELRAHVVEHPVVAPYYPLLLTAIDTTCCRWLYLSLGIRRDIAIDWRLEQWAKNAEPHPVHSRPELIAELDTHQSKRPWALLRPLAQGSLLRFL